ncbi:unnamed protein product [Withania somnifera]
MAKSWTFYGSYFIFTILISLDSYSSMMPNFCPTYMSFVFNATEFPSEDYYDYIVVGGGTAGCPLAATLSDKYRVLLLERGVVPYGRPNLITQQGFLTVLTDGVPNARGRILGGSSGINAGFYSRADQDFYTSSRINWDLKVVNQSYEWVEKAIVFRPELKSWQSAVRDGLVEAGIDLFNGFSLDHVIGTKIGGSTFDRSGRRHSAADLLRYANPSNIQVAVYASMERILLAPSPHYSSSKQAAIGVVFRDQSGPYHHAMVRGKGEVLVSAGALGSPQLLLLSGVGPRPYLFTWGIPVAHHLPYVGKFLFDNPKNGITIVPPMPLEHSLIQVVGITNSGAYLEAASNVIPFASPDNSVFLRTFPSPISLTVATLMEKIIGPVSSGSLRLGSTDRCVNGTRKIADVLKTRTMEIFKFDQWFGGRDFRYIGPALPVDESNDELMREFCHQTVTTIWHYHGGCVVGKVVDQNLRVLGIDGLRIVDGSVFRVSPGTNPQATLLMLGRYVGMMMLRERFG